MNKPRVVVPDDWPMVLGNSPAFPTLRERAELDYYDTLPGSEAGLVERMAKAEAVINIRSSSNFTAGVFDRCRSLRLLSLWRTGTDHVGLALPRPTE